jgi:hypothetical protein
LPALLFTACGGLAPLDGSLTAVCDVSYTRSTLEVVPNGLALRFLRARGAAEDTVLKVFVTVEGETPAAPTRWDLAEAMASGGQRGSATRNVLDEPQNTSFPALSRGSFRIEQGLTQATRVTGEVSLTFVTGNVLGSGRAVFGPFDAEVVR